MAATLAKGKKWDRVIKDGKVESDALQAKFDAETPKITLPFVIKGAVLLYMQHQGTAEPMEPKFKGHKEYTVQALVTAKVVKLLKKYHKKLSAKDYTAAKFKKQFGIDAPAGYADEEGDLHVIKLSSNANYQKGVKQVVDGKEVMVKTTLALDPPRVLQPDRTSLADTLIGNGSEATIGIELFTYVHPKFGFGCSVNLKMFNVTNLVEYVGKDESIDDDEMGFDEEVDDCSTDEVDDFADDTPTVNVDEAAEAEAKAQAASQAEAQKSATATEDDDDGIF